MSMDLNRIKIALELLDEKERQEALTETGKETEPQLSIWQRIRHSRHFDFVVKIGLMVGLFAVIHLSYSGLVLVSGMFPALVLDRILMAITTVLVLVIGHTGVDLIIYASERIYYNFIKRNSDHSFDYQETLKQLTPWQSVLITTLKVSVYLLCFALLYS
jgi:hypothetical protein